MIRRPLSLLILLKIVNLIIDIAGAAFLDLILFAVDENYLISFSLNLISILNFLWRLGAIAVLTENFN
jgi:hypothetical protein